MAKIFRKTSILTHIIMSSNIEDSQRKIPNNLRFDKFSFIFALFVTFETPYMVLNMGYFVLIVYITVYCYEL